MKLTYFAILSSLFLIYSCKNVPDSSTWNPDYLNRSIHPLEDFYEFSCGGWLQANPLQLGEDQRSILGELRKKVSNQVDSLIQTIPQQEYTKLLNSEKDSVVLDNIQRYVAPIYVENYFSYQKKQDIQELVNNIQTTLISEIPTFSWLTDETKQKAITKVTHFRFKIGYPDDWEQLTAWELLPQVVTANYNEKANEFYFPAGILQPPFYEYQGDEAWNYGAIGVVIAHEMIHALNDRGRSYDGDGNSNYWWTSEDEELFNEENGFLIETFNSTEVLEGVYANGELTFNENFADLIGIQIAFKAFQENKQTDIILDGFTPEQRFFIAYSVVKAANLSTTEIERLATTGIQSSGRLRVNGIVPHVPAFREVWE